MSHGSIRSSESEKRLNETIASVEKFKMLASQDMYSKLRNEREKATFSMMMKMNPEALTNIRKEFFAREDEISLEEFIYIIQKHLINRKGEEEFSMETPEQREFGINMYELFKDIDINGDGNLEWQEFTSFTVEKANLLNKRAKLTSIAHYYDSSDILDPSAKYRHRHDISKFINIPSLKQFAVLEDHKNAIFVFNSRLGKHVATINTESAPIAIEQFIDRDKTTLVASGADMTLSTYSLDDPNPKRRHKRLSTWACPGVQIGLAYAPETQLLYSGGTNGNIYSWNIQERNLVSTLTGHNDIVMRLLVLKNLNNIASASLDKTIAMWDSHTNEQLLKLEGHKKGVFDLTYNPNYRLMVSCGFEHDACVWSPFVNSLVYRLKGHHASLVGCQSVENSPEIVTADTSGVFKLWDVRNFQCVQTFSANLSGHDLKDSSKMTCFFQCKMQSRNSMQKEDDSRIYAASKNLFSFDQARVVHEATTDYYNVFFIACEHCTIITASERNVIIWDSLIGSKTFAHTNICGSDISASCLDDRKRKIILGDVNGHIKVFNCSNGQYMKGCNYHTHAAVVSLQYYDEAKRFLAGFANGVVGIFDENEMEECILIRCLDAKSQHSELRSMCLNQESKQILTVGGSSSIAKLWDYTSGKCDYELKTTPPDSESQVVFAFFLEPYPLVLTSDSNCNIIIWGAKGWFWEGKKLAAFTNAAPAIAEYEPRVRPVDKEEEEPPRRVIIPSRKNQSEKKSDDASTQQDEKSVGDENSVISLGEVVESIANAKHLIESSQKKWGKGFTAESACWDVETGSLYLGDSSGNVCCYDLNDLLDDLQLRADDDTSQSLSKSLQFNSAVKVHLGPKKILNICKSKSRVDMPHAALPPMPLDLEYKSHQGSTQKIAALQSVSPIGSPYNSKMPLSPPRNSPMRQSTSKGLEALFQSQDSSKHPSPSLHKTARTKSSSSQVVKFADPNKNEFVVGADDDAMCYLGIKFKWMLHAHADRLICCKTTDKGLLTSSADRLVKMWTFEGRPIGTLLQSVPSGFRNQSWGLLLNVESYVDQENEDLDEIIENVKKLAASDDKPDIKHMDFTGMQLGEQSADFSRSLLRQRIDKTSKLLGIEFPTHGERNSAADDSVHRLFTGSVDESHSAEDHGSLSKKSFASLTGALASVGSRGKSLEDALKEIKSPESAVDYETRSKKLSDIQKKRKELKMETLHKSFEEKTGRKIRSVTSVSLGDSGSGELNSGKAKEFGEVKEEKSINDLNSLSTSGPGPVGDSVTAATSPPPPLPSHKSDRRFTQTSGKIAEKLRQVKENGVRNIAMLDACQRYDSYAELEVSMKQMDPFSKLSEQQIEETRRRSQLRRKTILSSLGPDNPLLLHTLIRQRSGRAVIGTPEHLTSASSPPSTSGGNVGSENDMALATRLTSADDLISVDNGKPSRGQNQNKNNSDLLFDIQEGVNGEGSVELSIGDSSVVSRGNNNVRFDDNATETAQDKAL